MYLILRAGFAVWNVVSEMTDCRDRPLPVLDGVCLLLLPISPPRHAQAAASVDFSVSIAAFDRQTITNSGYGQIPVGCPGGSGSDLPKFT